MSKQYKKSATVTCIDCGVVVLHAHVTRKRCDRCAKIAQRKQSNAARQRNILEVRKRGAERKRIARQKDPEKCRAANLKWREKHREEAREKAKKWREDHPEAERQSKSNYYYKNWGKLKEQRAHNSDLLRERSRQYDKQHPDKMRARVKRRRARRLGAIGSHTVEQFYQLCSRLDWCCSYCNSKLDNRTVTEDHIIPLSKGGSDDIENIAPACRYCNTQKGARTYEEYMEYLKRCGSAP